MCVFFRVGGRRGVLCTLPYALQLRHFTFVYEASSEAFFPLSLSFRVWERGDDHLISCHLWLDVLVTQYSWSRNHSRKVTQNWRLLPAPPT